MPVERAYPVYSGKLSALTGWLGAFEAQWTQENPIDLDFSVARCNACIKVCLEHAIDFSYQIDLTRCRDHRDCVAACGAIGAIDFDRRETTRGDKFDLVLDLRRDPWFRMPTPPQGYFAPGADALTQLKAVAALTALTGEFEKPKYFNFKASICPTAARAGCTNCIDACDTAAIRPDGDRIFVEPHLCMAAGRARPCVHPARSPSRTRRRPTWASGYAR